MRDDTERIKVLYDAHQKRELFKRNIIGWVIAGTILVLGLWAMSQPASGTDANYGPTPTCVQYGNC